MKGVFRNLGNLLLGLLAALITSGIVIGSFVLSFAEGGVQLARAPAQTPTPVSSAGPTTLPLENTPHGGSASTSTSTPSVILTVPSPTKPAFTATATPTLPPPPTDCPPPSGWVPYAVRPGDTLNRLAETFGTTPEALVQGNCLIASQLVPGSILYVPETLPTLPPTNTPTVVITSIPCGPPSGWVRYTVRSGDTLFSLSLIFDVSVNQLQVANCLGSSTLIQAGQQIYVPFLPTPVPTNTPKPTKRPEPTSTPSPTDTPIPTDTPVPPTETSSPTTQPTNTPKPTKTSTNTPVPSATAAPTHKPTKAPKKTPIPTTPTSAPASISTTPAESLTPQPAAGSFAPVDVLVGLILAVSGFIKGTRRLT